MVQLDIAAPNEHVEQIIDAASETGIGKSALTTRSPLRISGDEQAPDAL
jgi:hypothetical protein